MTGPELVAALRRPEAYPHPVDRVEVIETHISWVFLAGERIYKVRKPVELGFLDFTTLERRRFFCREEVRLNQRLTDDVYLGVVELRGADRLRVEGPGPVREVAVAMRRLPHERMLDRLVRDGDAPPELLEEIGGVVARFHAADSASRAPRGSAPGALDVRPRALSGRRQPGDPRGATATSHRRESATGISTDSWRYGAGR